MKNKYIKKFIWNQNIYKLSTQYYPKDFQKIDYVLTQLFLSYHQKKILFENKETNFKFLKEAFKYLKNENFNHFFFVRSFICFKTKSDSIKIKKHFLPLYFSSMNLNIGRGGFLSEFDCNFEKIKKIVLIFAIPDFFLSKKNKIYADFYYKSIFIKFIFFCSIINFKSTIKKNCFFFDNFHGCKQTPGNNFINSICSIDKDPSLFIEKISKNTDMKKNSKFKLNKRKIFIKYKRLGKIKIFAIEDIVYFLNLNFFLEKYLFIKNLPSFIEYLKYLMREIKNINIGKDSEKIVFTEIFIFHLILKNMILFKIKKDFSLFTGKPLFYLKFLFRFERITWIFFQVQKLNFILGKQIFAIIKSKNLHICFDKNSLFQIFVKFFQLSIFFSKIFKKKFLYCDKQLNNMKKIVEKNKFIIVRSIDKILKNFEFFLSSNLVLNKILIFFSKIIPPIYNIVNVVEKEKIFKLFLKKNLNVRSEHISFDLYCFLVFHSDRYFEEIFTNFIIIINTWPKILHTMKFLDFSSFYAKKNFF